MKPPRPSGAGVAAAIAQAAEVAVGAETIAFTLVRSRRRRRTLTVQVDDSGAVWVRVPWQTAAEEVRRFVSQRASWIRRRQAEAARRPPPRALIGGETVPFLGRPLRLVEERVDRRRVAVRRVDGELRLAVPAELAADARRPAVEQALNDWYRHEAQAYFEARVAYWATTTGRAPAGVRVRDQRSRWGSCGHDGWLRFNWRLILAPPEVIDYVIVHELAHLAVMDHSPRFWAEVERHLPDWRARRAQLNALSRELTI